MLTLKQAIAEKHSIAEKKPFNQKMFRGELSAVEYIIYLSQIQPIFNHIERFPLPHPDLAREERAMVDISELRNYPENLRNYAVKPLSVAYDYMQYLLTLTQEQMLPHVYINYLALCFGGQMMKDKVPGQGRIYHFDNMQECIASIRALQKDEWADEANIALDYNIAILDELQEISDELQRISQPAI